jgi:hypothetical protein
MHILLKEHPLKDEIKENFFKLFIYIFKKVTLHIFFKPYILLIALLLIIKNNLIIFPINIVQIIGVLVCLVLFSLSVTLEEAFHAGAHIIQGRKQEVSDLVITVAYYKKLPLNGFGVSVFFNGRLTQNDLLFIMISGPVCSLITGFSIWIFFLFINFFVQISSYFIIIALIGFALLPVCSLLPINNRIVTSDGYKILGLKKKYSISYKKLLQLMKESIRLEFSYVLQSFHKKKKTIFKSSS